MESLFAARSLMGFSLAFHIVFSVIGMAMPFLMAIAYWQYLKTKQIIYLELTQAWSKGVAIFFATGAVSGTALSFELGLLWPRFMEHAGAIIGMPFSLEGAAFFLEAIALGIFLYGWKKVPKKVHWFAGFMVGVCGVASAMFICAANAWMNSPSGFDWVNGQAINIDPWQAMFNDRMLNMGLHMVVASFVSTCFGVGGLHAWMLLRRPESLFHQKAMHIALAVGGVFALIQPLSGHIIAEETAQTQPIKLAAMEGHFETQKRAPLLIGGIPDEEAEVTRYAIQIPGMLSFLAYEDFNAEVVGLKDFPKEDWPPVTITHIAFQAMVGLGSVLMALGALFFLLRWRSPQKLLEKSFLRFAALATPLGFFAVWAGWIVTEVGRQPWVIYKVMKTAEGVTPMPGISYIFCLFFALYLLLFGVVAWLLIRQVRKIEERGL